MQADQSRDGLCHCIGDRQKLPVHQPISPLDTEIDPGQTVEGSFVSAFKLTQQEWDARKGLDFTFAIQYQPNLKLTPHTAVIDR